MLQHFIFTDTIITLTTRLHLTSLNSRRWRSFTHITVKFCLGNVRLRASGATFGGSHCHQGSSENQMTPQSNTSRQQSRCTFPIPVADWGEWRLHQFNDTIPQEQGRKKEVRSDHFDRGLNAWFREGYNSFLCNMIQHLEGRWVDHRMNTSERFSHTRASFYFYHYRNIDRDGDGSRS